MDSRVTINGKDVEIVEHMTIAGVLSCECYCIDRVAVEKNGKIVPRSDFDCEMVMDGDKLEVVHFVGGG